MHKNAHAYTCGYRPSGINVIELSADILFTLSGLMKTELVNRILHNQ